MQRYPRTKTRKQLANARAAASIDTDQPLSAMENQPAILHCDGCEMSGDLHAWWRSVNGAPLHILCQTCRDKGER